MNASQRITGVDMPIIPTIAAMVRESPGCISLGQGVVNYGPPPQALAAIQEMSVEAGDHKYQAVSGYGPLVESLWGKLSSEAGFNRSGYELMITAGSNMAFLNALIAVADAGDEIILPTPYYFNQEMAVRMVGAVPVFVPTLDDYQLDVAALKAAVTPRTKAILTVSPNNPTGAVYKKQDLIAVNALCRDAGIYHFADEAYEYFLYDGVEHFSPGSLPDAQGHTLSFYSFSKTWGMASWRVGYVVYPKHLSSAMNKVQDTNLICAPLPSQQVANAALGFGKGYITPHLQSLATVRQRVYAGLSQLGDLISFPKTQGAFYVLAKLPGLESVEKVLAFNQTMARDYKVATIPGFAFGLTDTRAGNYQRLSYGALAAATVEQGVERFVAAVKAQY
jgi:aspartate/methionine/tyrosine aminotransferase